MFTTFNANGAVRDIQTESTQGGMEGTSLLIKVGEWQGRQGMVEDMLRVTLWNDRREMAQGVNIGDSVAVSGKVTSSQNQRGFWNTKLTVMGITVVQRSQQQMAQPAQQQPVQKQAYSDQDIPF